MRFPYVFLLLTMLLTGFCGSVQAQAAEDLLTIKNEPVSVSFISQFTPYLGQNPDFGDVTLVEDPIYNWTLTYTPDTDYLGQDGMLLVYFPFGYNVSFRRFAVRVEEADIRARHDLAETTAGTPVSIPVTDNDFANVGAITLTSVPVTNAGTSAIVGDEIVFTPEPGFTGLTDLNYVICTVGNTCDLGTVSINVLPQAGSTSVDTVRVFTKKDQPQFIFAEDGSQLQISPGNGSMMTVNGVAAYEPNAGYVGDEFITYANTGGGKTVFHVTVLDLVDNVFAEEDRAYTPTGAPVTLNVLHNDLYSIFSDCVSFGAPLFGSLSQTGTNGEVVYTPPVGWSGVDQFVYSSRPPGCNGPAESQIVYVFVSDYAPAAGTRELTAPEDGTINLTYAVPNGAADWSVVTAPAHGTISVDPVFNTLRYTPNPGSNGRTDNFSLRYCLNADASGNCAVSEDVDVAITITAATGDACPTDDCVWPGDTNNDGVVDVRDLLPIGQAMGQAGTPRLSAAPLAWGGQDSEDWDRHLNGLDLKHVDANGDQVISHLDTQVVMRNLGLGHRLQAEATTFTTFELSLTGPVDVAPGDLVELDIVAGNSAIIVEDVYGFHFPFVYDTTAVEGGSVQVEFGEDSWISYDSPIISVTRNDTTTGVINTAVTRTNGQNTSGFGLVGTLSAIIVEDVYGFRGRNLNAPATTGTREITLGGGEGLASDASGNGAAVRVNPITLRVHSRPAPDLSNEAPGAANEYLEDNLRVFPNPTAGRLTVHPCCAGACHPQASSQRPPLRRHGRRAAPRRARDPLRARPGRSGRAGPVGEAPGAGGLGDAAPGPRGAGSEARLRAGLPCRDERTRRPRRLRGRGRAPARRAGAAGARLGAPRRPTPCRLRGGVETRGRTLRLPQPRRRERGRRRQGRAQGCGHGRGSPHPLACRGGHSGARGGGAFGRSSRDGRRQGRTGGRRGGEALGGLHGKLNGARQFAPL